METSVLENQRAVTTNSEARMCTEHSYSEHDAYKTLIIEIGGDLTTENINNLAYMNDISLQEGTNVMGLDLLRKLEECGKISRHKINKLSEMLSNIKRSDLVTNKIEPFQEKYPLRNKSFTASTGNQLLTIEKRANTYSAFGSKENIADIEISPTHKPIQDSEAQPHSSKRLLAAYGTVVPDPIEPNLTSTPNTSTVNKTAAVQYSDIDAESQQSKNHDSYEVFGSEPSSSGIYSQQYMKYSSTNSRGPSISDVSSVGAELSMYFMNGQNQFNTRHDTQEDILQASHSQTDEHTLYRDPRRIQRSQSVAPLGREFVLVDSNLHSVLAFNHRSFTPPASVPLQREQIQSPLVTTPSKIVFPRNLDRKVPTQDAPTPAVSEGSAFTAPTFTSQAAADTLLSPIPSRPEQLITKSGDQLTDMYPTTLNSPHATSNTPSTQGTQSAAATDTLPGSGSSGSSNTRQSQPISVSVAATSEPDVIVMTDDHFQSQEDRSVHELHQLNPAKKLSRIRSLRERLRSKPLTERLEWIIKRQKLNKVIYNHREGFTIVCKRKLEIDVDSGSYNPKLTFILTPYGLGKDLKNNVTMSIYITASKKAPPLKESAAKVKLVMSIKESEDSQMLLNETQTEIDLNLRNFYWYSIVSHKALRDSKSDSIILEIRKEGQAV